MNNHCTRCQALFTITEEDRAFLEKIAPVIDDKRFPLPEPTLCPDCREQRRATFTNEINLYKRTCDFSGKSILSDKHPSGPYKVYEQEIWYSDKWDAGAYGRDFDFSRSFFEQWKELSLAVPYPALFTGYQYDENSAYTNYSGKNKNCYLIFDADENQDCYYGYSFNGSKDCMDCFRVRKSELSYGCIDCIQCYGSAFLQDSSNCSDSLFLKNCIGCRNCLFCVNLQNKEYHIENQPVDPAVFEERKRALLTRHALEEARLHFAQFALGFPVKAVHGVQNEHVTGDYLTGSKNARSCFDGAQLWDCAYLYRTFLPAKDCMDCEAVGEGELLYECCVAGYNAQNLLFCANCLDTVSNLIYCNFCFHSSDCFGCIGLNRKQYCIFNKQYTKEEYEALVPRIIAHMQSTGEWGQFFPPDCCLFAYNESVASEYYPLTRDEAIARGYTWREADRTEYAPATASVPETIDAIPAGFTQEILACAGCKRNYRLIEQEIALLRRFGLPAPDHCFFCRHRARMAERNSRKIFDRTCAKCSEAIQTTYSPERPEIVYCEQCYQKEVY